LGCSEGRESLGEEMREGVRDEMGNIKLAQNRFGVRITEIWRENEAQLREHVVTHTKQ
jgi:hypothetical protein